MTDQRIHRLLRLIVILQGSRARSVAELTTELGVSRRTLFRDLQVLQEAGVPQYHEAGVGYRLARGFFLPPVNLTVPETLGLMLLGKMALSRRNSPLASQALAGIEKLTATIPEPLREACCDLMAGVWVHAEPHLEADVESRHYLVLQRCIDEGRACAMSYRQVDPLQTIECEIEPYALHFANRAWYVLGQSLLHNEVRIFKLVRIQSLEMATRRFSKPKRFRVADKLGKAWQLIPEGKLYHVELEFSAKLATNVTEVRWHASQQQQILPDGRCRMRFHVDGLREIAWWICSYADQVVVRKPVELRQRVQQMLAQAWQQYAADASGLAALTPSISDGSPAPVAHGDGAFSPPAQHQPASPPPPDGPAAADSV